MNIEIWRKACTFHNNARKVSATLLKAELKRQGATYDQLVDKISAIGVVAAEVFIRNKLAR